MLSVSTYENHAFIVGHFAVLGFDDLCLTILCSKNNCFGNFGSILGSAFWQFYAEKCIIYFGQGGLFGSFCLILCIKIRGFCISATSLIHLDKQKQSFLQFLHLFSIIFVSFMPKNKGFLIARLLFCCIS